MSFDLFLTAFRDGASAPADAAAALAVLQRHGCQRLGGCYSANFADGSHVELFADGLDNTGEKPFDGGMFALRGLSVDIGNFIFEFSSAAGCVIFPAMEPACVLIPRPDLVPHIPAEATEDRELLVIHSGSEMVAALQGGHAAWAKYRDRVLSKNGGGSENGN